MVGMSPISAQSTKSLFGAVPMQLSGSTQLNGSEASAGTGYSTLDMNAFLTMFMKQLQFQDPTNPLQSYELAAQLAQFSSVERLTQVNTNLQTMQSYLASLNNSLMMDMLGKQVVGQSDRVTLNDGQISKGSYKLTVPATVTVKITDENGALVRTINVGTQNAGSYDLSWDGKNDAGEAMPNGTYHFEVEAMDSAGKSLDVATTVTGTVYSLRFEDGIPYFILDGANGVKLGVNEIIEIIGTSAEA